MQILTPSPGPALARPGGPRARRRRRHRPRGRHRRRRPDAGRPRPPSSCSSTCRAPTSTVSPAPSCRRPSSACPRCPRWAAARTPRSSPRCCRGSHTLRVWYDGPDKARLALLDDDLGETDVIVNGRDLWTWSSQDNEATHAHPPRGAARPASGPAAPACRPTPQEAATTVLDAIGPSTVVSTDSAVDGRRTGRRTSWCSPRRDDRSLISQVRIAVDDAHLGPAAGAGARPRTRPRSLEVGFTAVDFSAPGRRPVQLQPAAGRQGRPRRAPLEAPTPREPGTAEPRGGRGGQGRDPRRGRGLDHRRRRRSSPPSSTDAASGQLGAVLATLPDRLRRLGQRQAAGRHRLLRGAHRRRPGRRRRRGAGAALRRPRPLGRPGVVRPDDAPGGTGAPPVLTRGLTKQFRRQTAVDAVDLEVPAGAVYGFLGPNGSGKTTTIRMLLGLVRPTAGSVELLGLPMPERGGEALRRVGALVEGPAFHPYLSGRANLARLDAADRHSDARTSARPDRRRPGPRGPAGRGDQALPGLLPRHAAAAGHRQRPADAAGPAGPRRADQRPRPAGHPRGAPPGRRPRRRRRHRPGLQPPARRGGADVQPRRRHVRGPAGLAGLDGRAARRHHQDRPRRHRPDRGRGPGARAAGPDRRGAYRRPGSAPCWARSRPPRSCPSWCTPTSPCWASPSRAPAWRTCSSRSPGRASMSAAEVLGTPGAPRDPSRRPRPPRARLAALPALRARPSSSAGAATSAGLGVLAVVPIVLAIAVKVSAPGGGRRPGLHQRHHRQRAVRRLRRAHPGAPDLPAAGRRRHRRRLGRRRGQHRHPALPADHPGGPDPAAGGQVRRDRDLRAGGRCSSSPSSAR